MFFLGVASFLWFIFSNALICRQLYLAFLSVEHIMRDVSFWLVIFVIYILNGASFFFIVVYLHYFPRSYIITLILIYSSRYLLWAVGVVIFFLMIYYCFSWLRVALGTNVLFGVLLLSTNLVSAIPFIGNKIVVLLWGSFFISLTYVKIVFSFSHFFFPFILIALCCTSFITFTCNIIQINNRLKFFCCME